MNDVIDASVAKEFSRVAKKDEAKRVTELPLVGPQLGIWLADQLAPHRNTFAIAHYIDITASGTALQHIENMSIPENQLDIKCFKKAIALALSEVDTIHATYEDRGDCVVQRFHTADAAKIEQHIDVVDLSSFSRGAANDQSRQLMLDDLSQTSCLVECTSIFAHKIFILPQDSGLPVYRWYQRYHHIALDGQSFTALTKRVAEVYSALVKNTSLTPARTVSYANAFEKFNDYASSEKHEEDAKYWQKEGERLVPPLTLSYKNVSQESGADNQGFLPTHRHKITPGVELLENIQAHPEFSKFNAAEIAMAGIFIYIARMTGQSDVAVGFPFMRRMGSKVSRVAGPVMNVLPIQITVGGDDTLLSVCTKLVDKLRKAIRHQQYESDQLQRDLKRIGSSRKLDSARLYGPMLNFKMFDLHLDFNGLTGVTHTIASGPIDDIEFSPIVNPTEFSIDLAANASTYSQVDLILHAQRLAQLYETWGEAPSIKVSNLDLVSVSEAHSIARWSQGARVHVPVATRTVCDFLARRATSTPKAEALVFDKDRLTFKDFDKRVNQLARLLMSNGIGHGDIVAVALPRSIESIVSIFAIFSTGAAYLPLDLSHPDDRLAFMCEDASPSMVLAISETTPRIPAGYPNLCLDEANTQKLCASLSPAALSGAEKARANSPHDLAYIFYTSGSTGKPKGVMIQHFALLNLLFALEEEIFAKTRARKLSPLNVALTGSLSFDTSWDPILLMLLGHVLHIYPEELKRDPFALVDVIRKDKIDTLAMAPSLASQVLDAGLMEAGHHQPTLMDICGEAVSPTLWRKLQKTPQLNAYNIYGPTEFTVYATSTLIDANHKAPHIGWPLANTEVYVLDQYLQPLPIGAQGMLYLAGENMGAGYYHRAAQTATRFVANPFRHGQLMYQTGDLVRWTEEGVLEFNGRCDNQVKIRGHRIELGEVEAQLCALDEVSEVVVVLNKANDNHRMFAYCTLAPGYSKKQSVNTVGGGENASLIGEEVSADALIEKLAARVPEHFVPSALVILETFPLTVNGKIDKLALPEPKIEGSGAAGRLPKTELEVCLCAAMSDVLRVPNITMGDDFFLLGGDSISAMTLVASLRKQGFTLRPKDIFESRTVEKLLERVDISSNHAGVREDASGETHHSSKSAVSEMYAQVEDPVLHASAEAKYGKLLNLLPVLPLQEGLLFHSQLGEGSHNYGFTTRLRFNGCVDVARMQRALNQLTYKYPQLVSFFDVGLADEPIQLIPANRNRFHWPMQVHRLVGLNEAQQTEALDRISIKETLRHFTTIESEGVAEVPGMLNAAYVVHSDTQSTLILSLHHLVVDGWSTPILLDELMELYLHDDQKDLDDDVQWKKVEASAKQYKNLLLSMASRSPEHSRKVWAEKLKGVEPTLVFNEPASVGAPAIDIETKEALGSSEEGVSPVNECHIDLDATLSKSIHTFCKSQAVTINTLIQGTFGLALSVLSGKDDVVFGSPVSGRSSFIEGIEKQVGLFSNTLPVRITHTANMSVLSHFQNIQASQIELLEHDDLNIGEIQRLVDTGTLFDTLLVVENYPADDALYQKNYDNVRVKSVTNRGFTHYPLTVLVLMGEQPRILLEYRDGASSALVTRLGDMIVHLLEQITRSPELAVAELSMQTCDDAAFLQPINETQNPRSENNLAVMLAEAAVQHPSAIALQDEAKQLTYYQCRVLVSQLSDLLAVNGADINQIVAVALPRSVELTLALWATIDSGAAYLPLDVQYPDERLSYMLNDASPKVVITDSANLSRMQALVNNDANFTWLCIDEVIDTETAEKLTVENATKENPIFLPKHPYRSQETAAYVIYTSGSTGRPKGVVISHGAIVNRLQWMQDTYPIDKSDVVLQKTPASFDVSVWEFFWAPLLGAKLVMAPPEAHKDPERIFTLIEKHKVTTLHFVPSMLSAFLAHISGEGLASQTNLLTLKQVFCSGEALSVALTEKFSKLCRAGLHNLYGPTEAAVDVSYYAASLHGKSLATLEGVPIGKPVWNTQLYVLDQCLREVPVGMPGELYLAGDQLAKGYLGRAGLTAERFVANPFANGERMYRTGDIVRWGDGGVLYYQGRTDDQIKIRGQRVEIGEIETALQSLAQIKHAVVLAKNFQLTEAIGESDNRQLVAYVVPEIAASFDREPCIAALEETLPAHMVPKVFVTIDAVPVTVNGKLDKKALPEPEFNLRAEGRRPKPGIEAAIAGVFEKLLNVNDVHAEDSFFDLGGHSLLAMQLVSMLKRALEVPVSVGQIMVSPTVELLARVLGDEDLRNDKSNAGFGLSLPIRAVLNPSERATPLFCINPASGFAWQYTGFPRYLEGNYPIVGLQSPRPEGAISSCDSMDAVVEKYFSVLRDHQPRGPYHLLGYSFGGTVAIALASKLAAIGEEVAFVGLLDTYPPEGQEWRKPTDEEAMEEVEREKQQFMLAAQDELSDAATKAEQEKMFGDIVKNYDDAVTLLAQATTQPYTGEVHIFVAENSLPEGWDVAGSWSPFVSKLVQHRQPFNHDDILSPKALEAIGPLLNRLLAENTTLGERAK